MGELYINGKFLYKLNDSNRIVTVDAQKNLKIKIKNGYKERVIKKDIYANDFLTIKYKLRNIPLDVRLYTTSFGALMWEDTKKAKNNKMDWEKAVKYCRKLDIGQFGDWRLPTIDELADLYENIDKIYNGYSDKFYWSSDTYTDKTKTWEYSMVYNFAEDDETTAVKEFDGGSVRCVRDITKDEM